jgi:hypothetical protein
MQLGECLHRHLINLEMSLLATAFLVHHTDEVSKPVCLVFFLVVIVVETVNILPAYAAYGTIKGTDGVLYLPHI